MQHRDPRARLGPDGCQVRKAAHAGGGVGNRAWCALRDPDDIGESEPRKRWMRDDYHRLGGDYRNRGQRGEGIDGARPL